MPLIRNLNDIITITPQGPLSLPHVLEVRTYIMDLQTQFSLAQGQGGAEPADGSFHHGSMEWNSNSNMFPFFTLLLGLSRPNSG